MRELAQGMPGSLGAESSRDVAEGVGITVSYCNWREEASVLAWKKHIEHTIIQARGRAEWYLEYATRVAIAFVQRAYGRGFEAPAIVT